MTQTRWVRHTNQMCVYVYMKQCEDRKPKDGEACIHGTSWAAAVCEARVGLVEQGLLFNHLMGLPCLWLALSISVAWEDAKWHKDMVNSVTFVWMCILSVRSIEKDEHGIVSISSIGGTPCTCGFQGAWHGLWAPLGSLPCWEHSPKHSLGGHDRYFLRNNWSWERQRK